MLAQDVQGLGMALRKGRALEAWWQIAWQVSDRGPTDQLGGGACFFVSDPAHPANRLEVRCRNSQIERQSEY